MASLVANDASAIVVEVTASPSRVAAARSTAATPPGLVAATASPSRVAAARSAAATPTGLVDAIASPARVAGTTADSFAATSAAHVALPARSASLVRIAGLAVLCAATLVAPALLLVWMPIVLGVPHIASDIRFLVLPLPRRQVIVSLVACASLVVVKALALSFGWPLLRLEMVVVATWLLLMLALERSARRSHAIDRRSHARARHAQIPLSQSPEHHRANQASAPSRRHATSSRSAAVWLLLGSAAFAIVALPIHFAIFAAFAHNFVAVVAWVIVKRPTRRHTLAVIATLVAAIAVLVAAGPAIASLTGGAASPWLTIDKAASVMFAGVPLPTARGLMIAFAFLQGVHYAIWLDWVPRGATRMATKPWLLVLAGTLVVVAAALVNPAWARSTYLALATFHIYLELVVLAARAARRYA